MNADEETRDTSDYHVQLVSELENVRRDNFKLRTALASTTDGIEKVGQDLGARLDETAKQTQRTLDYLSRQLDIHERLVQERLKTAQLTQELNSWRQFAVAYAHVLERTLAHPCLTEAYRDAAAKLLHDYTRLVGPLGIDLIMPQQGDPFDERIHQIVEEQDVAGLPPLHIVRPESWGIRNGAVVLERARVIVTPRATT